MTYSLINVLNNNHVYTIHQTNSMKIYHHLCFLMCVFVQGEISISIVYRARHLC